MPWGYECRRKLIKQNALPPTTPRKKLYENPEPPGPFHYEAPEVYCGKGYSRIKRAPAYSFGLNTPAINKPAARPNAPTLNIRNMTIKGGQQKVLHGVISPRLDPHEPKVVSPGPAIYQLKNDTIRKKAPAYTMQHAVKPLKESETMWTPGPNMYWPPIPGKKAPAYSFNSKLPKRYDNYLPGPGAHDPKFENLRKSTPAFTFGHKYDIERRGHRTPAPNNYCQRKFMYPLKRGPAPSFGIRHSPYLGRASVWIKSSKIDNLASDGEN